MNNDEPSSTMDVFNPNGFAQKYYEIKLFLQ